METCIKCGAMVPANASVCPSCGNPVSLYGAKGQPVFRFPNTISPIVPVQPVPGRHIQGQTILVVGIVVLCVVLITSIAFMTILGSMPAKLTVSPAYLNYGTLQVGKQTDQTLTLSNSGRQDLNWTTSKEKADWLTLIPSQGRIPSGESQDINVRADTTLLVAGQYSAKINFTSNGGDVSVNVVMTTIAGGPEPTGLPVVASIEPRSGPASGGTSVVIRGIDFTGASRVLFGTTASNFTVNSNTQITAVSPAGSGTAHVTVTTHAGTNIASDADQFIYLSTPTITSIQPIEGPASGGTRVTIRGSGFTGTSEVLFGSTIIRDFTVKSDSEIIVVSPKGSGTVHILVTTPIGTSRARDFDRFVYLAAPTITSIQPAEGPASGGTNVVIRGTGFTRVSRVLFDATTSKFTVDSDTQITVVSPVGNGMVHVTVITPMGTTIASDMNRFTYVVAPKITSIDPQSGPPAGGTEVTIQGSGFTGASKVLFGSITVKDFTVKGDSQIAVVSPRGSGTMHITVITPTGTTTASNVDRFTYVVAMPKIISINPQSGPPAGGTEVTIQGSGFTGASRVLFGSIAVKDFTVKGDGQIAVVSPRGSGTIHIAVITPIGTSTTSDVDHFTYIATPPQITSINPKEGTTLGGTRVTIRGSGFTDTSKVLFGSTATIDFTVNSDTQITAVSPIGHGTVSITVITHVGTSTTSDANRFAYIVTPTIASIQPAKGPMSGGTNVVIQGTSFTGVSRVLFGATASKFTVNNDTQITATSPTGSGVVHIMVVTRAGTTTANNTDLFTYVAAPPQITSMSPTSGPATGGTKVTIQGSGFTGTTRVLFDTTASTYTVDSNTQITAVSPAGRGTVQVIVITPTGTTATNNIDRFTYIVAAPQITNINPQEGPTTGGTQVTIQGNGFTGTSKIMFGPTAVNDFTVNSDGQITAVSPRGSGTVHIAVITPTGTITANKIDSFTYIAAPPQILSINPQEGPTAGGTQVTVQGSGFTDTIKVMFGPTTVNDFTVNSDTQITVVSPAGSGTVHIVIITPIGTTTASNVDQFQYN